MTSWREQVTKSEVNDLDVSRLADENILNLKISVVAVSLKKVIQSTGNLSAEFSRLLLFQLPVGDNVVEHLATIHILK